MERSRDPARRFAIERFEATVTNAFKDWLSGPEGQLLQPEEYAIAVGEFAALALATIFSFRPNRGAGPLTEGERDALETWCQTLKRRVEANVRL